MTIDLRSLRTLTLAICGLITLAGLGILCPAAAAQQPTPPAPPSQPFVKIPPQGKWTVKVRHTNEPEANPDKPDPTRATRLRQIQSKKAGELKQDVLLFADGRQEEVWYRQGLQLTSDGKRAFVSHPSDDAEGTNIGITLTSGFPGVEWILPEHYSGTEKAGKETLYLFQSSDGKAKAWIKADDRRPVRVQIGSLIYDFQFEEPSSEKLAMPKIYQEAWDRYSALSSRRAKSKNSPATGLPRPPSDSPSKH